MKRVFTYGTFDMLHYGHIVYLKKARLLGEYLIVGLRTDELALIRGKKTYYNYSKRKEILEAIKYVDEIIEYKDTNQKIEDIKRHKIDIIVICEDSPPLPDEIKKYCKIVKYNRMPKISTTVLKNNIKIYKSNEKHDN